MNISIEAYRIKIGSFLPSKFKLVKPNSTNVKDTYDSFPKCFKFGINLFFLLCVFTAMCPPILIINSNMSPFHTKPQSYNFSEKSSKCLSVRTLPRSGINISAGSTLVQDTSLVTGKMLVSK